MNKTRLKTTITFEYDADPESYGTDNPVKMAKIDQTSFNEDPNALFEMILDQDYTLKVVPIQTEPLCPLCGRIIGGTVDNMYLGYWNLRLAHLACIIEEQGK